jgi:hypothetical protein
MLLKKAAEEKLLEKQANIDRNNQATNTNVAIALKIVARLQKSTLAPPSMAAVNPLFYFYNYTVAFGKVEFKKNLGKCIRKLATIWHCEW